MVDNNIKEIRELPSMICRDLNIKDSFNYEGYAITESYSQIRIMK